MSQVVEIFLMEDRHIYSLRKSGVAKNQSINSQYFDLVQWEYPGLNVKCFEQICWYGQGYA